MKTLFTLSLIFTLFAGTTVKGQVSATGHVFAEVVESLTASETSSLDFGRFAPQTEGGRIMVSATGERSASGTVALGNGTNHAASFLVTGQDDAAFAISLPAGPIYLTNSNNGSQMQVGEWVSNLSSGYGILDQGVKTVTVGATLFAGDLADNPVGVYSGTYVVTFDYN